MAKKEKAQTYRNGDYKVEIVQTAPGRFQLAGNWNSGPTGWTTTTLRDMQANLRDYGFRRA